MCHNINDEMIVFKPLFLLYLHVGDLALNDH